MSKSSCNAQQTVYFYVKTETRGCKSDAPYARISLLVIGFELLNDDRYFRYAVNESDCERIAGSRKNFEQFWVYCPKSHHQRSVDTRNLSVNTHIAEDMVHVEFSK
jgi:hypothetical protein